MRKFSKPKNKKKKFEIVWEFFVLEKRKIEFNSRLMMNNNFYNRKRSQALMVNILIKFNFKHKNNKFTIFIKFSDLS